MHTLQVFFCTTAACAEADGAETSKHHQITKMWGGGLICSCVSPLRNINLC